MCFYHCYKYRCSHQKVLYHKACTDAFEQLDRINDPHESKDIIPFDWADSCAPSAKNTQTFHEKDMCFKCMEMSHHGFKFDRKQYVEKDDLPHPPDPTQAAAVAAHASAAQLKKQKKAAAKEQAAQRGKRAGEEESGEYLMVSNRCACRNPSLTVAPVRCALMASSRAVPSWRWLRIELATVSA